MAEGRHPASFRDDGGWLFTHEGVLFRQIEHRLAANFSSYLASGLHAALVDDRMIVEHEVVDPAAIPGHERAYRIIRPEIVPFISYPYEWTFGQLKDAALLTLAIQERALDYGMTLRDASAFNVQFIGTRPVFIDTTSFAVSEDGQPWVGYQQFCRHFLAPLALISHVDPAMSQLSRIHLDGIPLHLATRLLPKRTLTRFGLLSHLHVHARSIRRHGDTGPSRRENSSSRLGVTEHGMRGLIESLRAIIGRLDWDPTGTEWARYALDTNYSAEARADKKRIVSDLVDAVAPTTAIDLGANDGEFSRMLSGRGIRTLAVDHDPAASEQNYRRAKNDGTADLLPLVVDLMNPSPNLGWAGHERDSLDRRGPFDLSLALALVHHLAIGNNVPFAYLASFFRKTGRTLIVEFVPKHDSQIQRLLTGREDVFDGYDEHSFEEALSGEFVVRDKIGIADCDRTIYLCS